MSPLFRNPIFVLLLCWLTGVQVMAAQVPSAAQRYIDRATKDMRIDPESSRSAAEAALVDLKRHPNVDLEIRARLILCDYYSERDQAAGRKQLEFAIALVPHAQRTGLRAGILTCQGDIAETAGDPSKAKLYFDQAVAVARDSDDREMLAQALYSRGALVGVQGDFAKGLSDLQQAQRLFEQLDMPLHALTVHNNVAILYSRMGDYEQALKVYRSTLKAQRKAGMRRDMAVTLHNIGRTNEHLGRWSDANAAYSESLALSRELHYKRGEAYALRGEAAAVAALGDPQRALELLDQAAKLQREGPDASLAARIRLTRGKALLQLKRYGEALAQLESARRFYSQADALIELGATYDVLAEANAATHAWRAAYDYRAQAEAVERQLFRNRFDQRLATLKVEFDTASKEKENVALVRENEANAKALEQERNAKRLQAVVIALAALLVAVLTAVAWRARRASRSMRRLAMTDELTGVPNRRAALRHLETIMRQATAQPCAVLIIDIDHFKAINDRCGHPEGDEALKCVADKLKSLSQAPAFLGRLGGEEFVAILQDVDMESARLSAELYRAQVMSLDAHRWVGDRRLTISIGVSLSRPGEDTPITMLQRADGALYVAKHAGRNRVMTEQDVDAQSTDETAGNSTGSVTPFVRR